MNGDEGSPTADADAHGGDADAEAPSDQKVVAKFLVSNAAAGSVIGKGGSNIAGGDAGRLCSSHAVGTSMHVCWRTHVIWPGQLTFEWWPVCPVCMQHPHNGSILCAEFQTQSSARIQLSRANEFFPGTSDRVMLISGTVGQVSCRLLLLPCTTIDPCARTCGP